MAADLPASLLYQAGNLSGLASLPTARTNLGLGSGDSPTFAGITLTGVNSIQIPNGGTIVGSGPAGFSIGDSNDYVVFGAATNYITGSTIIRGPISNDSGNVVINADVTASRIALGGLTPSTYGVPFSVLGSSVMQGSGVTDGGMVLSLFANVVTGTLNVLSAPVAATYDARIYLFNAQTNGHSTCHHLVSVGTGDARTQYATQAGAAWTAGLDQSDSNKYKISNSSALGTTDRFVIDTSGNITAGGTGTLVCAGDSVRLITDGTNGYVDAYKYGASLILRASGDQTVVTLDLYKNATFAGNITASGNVVVTGTNKYFAIDALGSSTLFKATANSSTMLTIGMLSSTNVQIAANNGYLGLVGQSVTKGVNVTSYYGGAVALSVQCVAGQTANLTEWQTTTGTVLASVNPIGSITTSGYVTGLVLQATGTVAGSAQLEAIGYQGYLCAHTGIIFSLNHLNVGAAAGEVGRIVNGNWLLGTSASVASGAKLDVYGNTNIVGNITASGSIGFSQSRFQQSASQTLQTQCYDTSLSAWQETSQQKASPSGALYSVLGSTPIAKQTHAAVATDLATAITRLNQLCTHLTNFGFFN